MRNRLRKGFTLIELLVVIAIIGLLSTLAVVAMSNARQKARDAKRVSDIKQMQSALDLYATDKNGYPRDESDGVGGITLGGPTAKCISDATGFGGVGECTGNTYMANVPSNTTPGGTPYLYRSVDAAGADCNSSPCVGYSLVFWLEADTGELKDGTDTPSVIPECNATPGGITCT
ncbi:MAG: type II secretion system protein [bacterium]|nr:type II secretion system protein [bacterium]MDP3770907.1 type II secretion system protein [bacterium]